ncbi:MAG: dihydropteroate synthase [Flavobacteriales bacterium]
MPFESQFSSINCQGQLIDLSEAKVMGILNLTPDSFYDGGELTDNHLILKKVEQMLDEGVDFIDLGAASSRPGSKRLTPDEEAKRLLPSLNLIKTHFPEALLSVDTYHVDVAKQALDSGVAIINDISGGQFDNQMFKLISDYQVPYVLMHLQGDKNSFHQANTYDHLLNDMVLFFSEKITKLQALGVNDLIIDPGFGFSKTINQNFELLRKLEVLTVFDLPILVGLSRKSMLYKTLDITAKEALSATSVTHYEALRQGAKLLRVHDVKEAKQTITLFNLLNPKH